MGQSYKKATEDSIKSHSFYRILQKYAGGNHKFCYNLCYLWPKSRNFAPMLSSGILLLASLMTISPEDEDSIRHERLEEVVVTSSSARQRIQNVQTGAEVLQLEDLTTAPQLFGEVDIMRSIQLLPGVKAESDASSSFQVRGGTSAQNQVLFDLTPVYNTGHLAGLFSAFNDDALASATLYKGLLPAQFGGASSTVMAR